MAGLVDLRLICRCAELCHERLLSVAFPFGKTAQAGLKHIGDQSGYYPKSILRGKPNNG